MREEGYMRRVVGKEGYRGEEKVEGRGEQRSGWEERKMVGVWRQIVEGKQQSPPPPPHPRYTTLPHVTN